MLETIQQSAIPHDRYQLELKLDYELGRKKKTHYRISTYIFIPRSLGITEEIYPKAEFYRDVRIIDEPNWYADHTENQRVIQALRLFGAMFKSSLREHLNLIHKRINASTHNTKITILIEGYKIQAS